MSWFNVRAYLPTLFLCHEKETHIYSFRPIINWDNKKMIIITIQVILYDGDKYSKER